MRDPCEVQDIHPDLSLSSDSSSIRCRAGTSERGNGTLTWRGCSHLASTRWLAVSTAPGKTRCREVHAHNGGAAADAGRAGGGDAGARAAADRDAGGRPGPPPPPRGAWQAAWAVSRARSPAGATAALGDRPRMRAASRPLAAPRRAMAAAVGAASVECSQRMAFAGPWLGTP